MLIGGKTLIQHRNHARASSRTIQPLNTPVSAKLKAPVPCYQSENMKMSLRTISWLSRLFFQKFNQYTSNIYFRKLKLIAYPLLELYYCMNSIFKFAFKLFSEHLGFIENKVTHLYELEQIVGIWFYLHEAVMLLALLDLHQLHWCLSFQCPCFLFIYLFAFVRMH